MGEGIYKKQKNGGSKEEQEENVSILELIDDKILKMCGIHDFDDRNVILMHIESLIQSNGICVSEEKENDVNLIGFDDEEGDVDEFTKDEENDEDLNDVIDDDLIS